MTAVATAVFTAAQWNTSVRDNINECPTAKATTLGSIFAVAGTNLVAQRTPARDVDNTEQFTSSTSYVDLDPVSTGGGIGPSVTVDTGPIVQVHIYCQLKGSAVGASVWAGFDIAGSHTLAASDVRALQYQPAQANGFNRYGATFLIQDVTPGTNIFTMRYRASSGTAGFAVRNLAVVPF